MMLWRSPREIAFRLNQEGRNLALWLRPPSLPAETGKLAMPLPRPDEVADHVRESRLAAAIAGWAEQILAHRFPLLGLEIDTGPEIRWQRDYQSGKETAPVYFRCIPYLAAERAGDHKIIWELNRHQHLVLLAQAYQLTGRAEFLDETGSQLDSWIEANPFQCGINWASALEVAFRALSWIWVHHLVGDRLDSALRRRFLEGLFRHGLHLANNLSVYFSPNTHLLGEAVALHALGLLFHGVPGARTWEKLGAEVTAAEMERQVRADGSHFEQSTYYHVYALDMFLFHAALAPPSESYRGRLARMAEYLDALLGPSRSLPPIGDDDGGRFFHPYGRRDRFGRATLATCGALLGRTEWIVEPEDLYEQAVWWLGPQSLPEPGERVCGRSRWFPDAGTGVMVAGSAHVVADAGPFGGLRSGHSHADTLSLVVRHGDQDLLIDPGTYTYVGDPHGREVFRGTAAHNTVRLDRLDQAAPAGPFGWRNPPQVALNQWRSDGDMDDLDAECRYRGFRHRRRIRFLKAGVLLIVDEIEGPPGEHAIEQFWHLGSDAARSRLVLEEPVESCDGWRSPVFLQKLPAPVLCVRRKTTLPYRLAAGVLLDPGARLGIEHADGEIRFHWQRTDNTPVTISF
jgi:hypothetical protein